MSEDEFRDACRALPLVSADIYLTRQTAAGQAILLGLRLNAPARGYWFTPGGRIRKNEPFMNALLRIAHEEIGLSADFVPRLQALGVWDHFYSDSAFDSQISTHYVNLAYRLHLSDDEAEALQPPKGADQQHAEWRWITITSAHEDEEVHENVRVVLAHL